jgi:hypothetical protein
LIFSGRILERNNAVSALGSGISPRRFRDVEHEIIYLSMALSLRERETAESAEYLN